MKKSLSLLFVLIFGSFCFVYAEEDDDLQSVQDMQNQLAESLTDDDSGLFGVLQDSNEVIAQENENIVQAEEEEKQREERLKEAEKWKRELNGWKKGKINLMLCMLV